MQLLSRIGGALMFGAIDFCYSKQFIRVGRFLAGRSVTAVDTADSSGAAKLNIHKVAV